MQKVGQMAETIKTFQVAQIGKYIIKHVIVEISKKPPKIAIYWFQIHKFYFAKLR